MPNGNVLAIAWESKSLAEAQAAGSAPEMTPERGLWPDMILELEKDGPTGARVVWEWHSWDHLIQDTDPGLPDHGNLSEHPERINVNGNRSPPDRITEEQIALSSNTYSEIWIIDHSTTTEEAVGSTGSRWGKGGDLRVHSADEPARRVRVDFWAARDDAVQYYVQ